MASTLCLLGWPGGGASSLLARSVVAASGGSSRSRAITTTTTLSAPADEPPSALARVLAKLQQRGREGSAVEKELVVQVPSMEARCGRAGGSLLSQRNGWLNQDLLPVLSAVGDLGVVDVAGAGASLSVAASENVVAEGGEGGAYSPSQTELRRLQTIGLSLKHSFKIGRLGVTEGVVQITHNVWRSSEVVKVRCHGPAAADMRHIADDLERKTGGSVIWRSEGVVIVYRGKDYNPDWRPAERLSPRQVEVNDVLEGLGPRYHGWLGAHPVPVDGDLLTGPPAQQYRRPFRLLPCGSTNDLSRNEQTLLRRANNILPPHIVVGKVHKLEFVAVAILELWETCEVAKVAAKPELPCSSLWAMVDELQRLTGGVVLSRCKGFVLLYRGKDFLPPTLSAALLARKNAIEAAARQQVPTQSMWAEVDATS